MSQAEQDVILVEYYQGAYGPTIRMAPTTLESLRRLRDFFLDLAEGRQEVELEDLGPARMVGIQSLSFRLGTRESPLGGTLQGRRQTATGLEFVWTNSAQEWMDCADMVDNMIVGGEPGHQYLTVEGVDDALVEVSYAESGGRLVFRP
ncbi:MAG: hypothetical protein L0332_35285 [Chloroflexi bacterium]|nr:hypothetical protein [Chloroflexota bacterium]MCI0579001.1 hypothetical protein [Chloroflexota bacterium]MCI0644788.1 hypothetical protein [Chloroflexota bacterium]MCI0731963.1 hypothetical protein [Chloroflexota bacterium]